jgi:hypothetical protein
MELKQGSPEVQIKPPECHIHMYSNAPPGRKKNFRCALLVNLWVEIGQKKLMKNYGMQSRTKI